MDNEKRIIEGYEAVNIIRLARGEIILAIKDNNAEPYMVCDCSWNNPFNVNEYSNAVVSDDYMEIIKEFNNRITARIELLETERRERNIPLETFTAADCDPKSREKDYNDLVVVINPKSLSPEYRTSDHQLVLCKGGNGARANAIGRSVFCIDLYEGKDVRWTRSDIAGIILPERLPEWAKEKLAALNITVTEKESVTEKIKESKQNQESKKAEKSTSKKKNKNEQEI